MRTIITACLLLAACSDDSGPSVSPGAPLGADASPGAVTCSYAGKQYDDGAVFPASDGCNECKCNPSGNTPGQVGCSLKACLDGSPPSADTGAVGICEGPEGSATHGTTVSHGESCCTCSAPGNGTPAFSCVPKVTTVKCNYNGTLYDNGQVFPAGDGCNTCKCNPTGCMPGKWGCSLIGCSGHDAGPTPDAAVPDAPADRQRPDDGPPPDFLRPEHPGGVCPIEPPTPGTACSLEANQGCGYRPVCETGTPVNQYCNCPGGSWACDDGGFCARN
jgi:hypothetical protein